jgi:energy-coupling factor transporter ATP-binding protein EcfA2
VEAKGVAIDEFEIELTKSGLGPGARWRKADFHVHLPGSSDYKYREPDAMQRLGQVLRVGNYSFAVVVKHEEFPTPEELRTLQRSCPTTTLVPGAEINVFVDVLDRKVQKDHFFHCIVAVDPARSGGYAYVLQRAKADLRHETRESATGFASSLVDVARFLRAQGALFIPAHLHQAKGVEESRSIDDIYGDDAFLGFVQQGYFSALEVRQRSTAAFFSGEQKTKEGRLIPRSVCVASSDCHHHDELASRDRFTWVRTETTTFAELEAALAFKHRVELDDPLPSHPRVLGLHVVGSFLPDTRIQLNEGLNALIGAKGSGKTALLECLRFVLNAPIPGDRRESVDRHVANVLGPSGFVECLALRADGSKVLVTRRIDSRDRIGVSESDGTSRVLGAKDVVPFSVSILGWHEIEAIADKAQERVHLLDRVGDPQVLAALGDQMKAQIDRARDELPILQRTLKKLDAQLNEYWTLRQKRDTLERLKRDDLVDLQRRYEWFLASEQALESLARDARSREDSIPDLLGAAPIFSRPNEEPLKGIANTAIEVVDAVAATVVAHEAAEGQSVAQMQTSLLSLARDADDALATVRTAFGMFRDTDYSPRVAALSPEDRDVLTSQIQVLEDTKRLPQVERECDLTINECRKLAEILVNCCDAVIDVRRQMVAHREQLVAEVNAELPHVRLKLLPASVNDERGRFHSRYGEEGGVFVSYLSGFGGSGEYEHLKSAFQRLASIAREDTAVITNKLWDLKLVELLEVVDEDDVEISLDVGKAGFVPIQNLSSGQRSVAVFPLLLRNSRGPLVIDQPEDNLDNRYIADTIAPDLLAGKKRQQYLVTSHNANLVVLGDADLIVHVDADGTRASFPADGFLSCPTSEVKDAVLSVLDGGAEALDARQRKYGVPPARG